MGGGKLWTQSYFVETIGNANKKVIREYVKIRGQILTPDIRQDKLLSIIRPLRIEYPNAVYHVMNRGRGRANIFHGKAYTDAFLLALAEAHQQFGLEILTYCL